MHISFKRIGIKNSYAKGKIIRFNHVDKITEVFTSQSSTKKLIQTASAHVADGHIKSIQKLVPFREFSNWQLTL